MLEAIFSTTLVFLVLGILIVLILSFAALVIFEWVSAVFRWRSKFLEQAIRQMLGNDRLADMLYAHPLVKNLYLFGQKPGRKPRLPSYIPAREFAMALFEIVSLQAPDDSGDDSTLSIDRFHKGLRVLDSVSPRLTETLRAFWRNAEATSGTKAPSVSQMLVDIEGWFNDEMDALARYFRQKTRLTYYIIGLVLAFFLNIDSGRILSTLWFQATFPQRQVILEQTVTYLGNNSSSAKELEAIVSNEIRGNLDILNFPIGWQFLPFNTGGKQCSLAPVNGNQIWGIPSWDNQGMPICKTLANTPIDLAGWLGKLVGMFATVAFIPIGASIMFNMMKKMVNTRSTGVEPAE